MNIFEFVVLIVLIATIGKIVQNRLASRDHLPFDGDRPETMRLRDEVRALKDRIQVLERVVTDNHGSHDLDREIERLRDR